MASQPAMLIRCTAEQRATIQEMARKAGLTRNEYILQVLLGESTKKSKGRR